MTHTLLCFATQPGGTTLDRDVQGGNPFASALVACIPHLASAPASRLKKDLQASTHGLSEGHQSIDWQATGLPPGKPVAMGSTIVLMLVCHRYLHLAALPGASFDKKRLAATFALNEASVLQNSDETVAGLKATLRGFARISSGYDTAVIYSTGHGLQQSGVQYLLPADIAVGDRLSSASAITVSSMLKACRGAMRNVVFFAGCRELYEGPGPSR